MALLAPADRDVLRDHFSKIQTPVELVLFTQPASGLLLPGGQPAGHGHSSADTETLLKEVVELSPSITLSVHNLTEEPEVAEEFHVTEAPTIAICPEGQDLGIRFMGLPSGYEFTSLVETINAAGGAGHPLLEETIERLQELETDIHIKTFSTPT